MKLKANSIIATSLGLFLLWVAYIIYKFKIDPKTAILKAWEDIKKMFEQILNTPPSVGIIPNTGGNIAEEGTGTGTTTLYGNVENG